MVHFSTCRSTTTTHFTNAYNTGAVAAGTVCVLTLTTLTLLLLWSQCPPKETHAPSEQDVVKATLMLMLLLLSADSCSCQLLSHKNMSEVGGLWCLSCVRE